MTARPYPARRPVAPRPASAQGELGFVLVGVVMFVLALTILGISLFTLSNYEAEFMGASFNQSQAFYDAVGGIERCKYILTATGDPNQVRDNLPPGVIYARAMQHGDSSGTSWDWYDTTSRGHIQIRVAAQYPPGTGEIRMVEAEYAPSAYWSLYRNAIETTGSLWVPGLEDAVKSVVVWGGSILQNGPNWSEWSDPNLLGGDARYASGWVPAPEVDDFIRMMMRGSPGVADVDDHTYTFDLGTDSMRVFVGADYPSGSPFGVDDHTSGDIDFEIESNPGATVIWLLPQGARFSNTVEVSAPEGTNLVIVAKQTSDSRNVPLTGAKTGLEFDGGITAPRVNLFLVSDGTVVIDRPPDPSVTCTTKTAAIFAGGVYIRGPKNPEETQLHAIGDRDDILRPLYDNGWLPNTVGRNRAFTLVPGSFREVDGSNWPD